ncbi:MAG: ATP-dependent zinc metalloprotease FtsH [Elusimicrobiaceae bacterium]|nr:ATP-dependent zinc metalloprotease FtsH [Elusimicrobiaceae bacterium]
MKRNAPNPALQIFVWLGAILVLLLVYQHMQGGAVEKQLAYSEFKSNLKAGNVENVRLSPELITGTLKENGKPQKFRAVAVKDDNLVSELESGNVKFEGTTDKSWVTSVLLNLGWIAIFIFLWWFMFLRGAGGGKQAMSFARSRAKRQENGKGDVTFKDVAGCDEAKEELQDVIEFLKDPKRFRKLGGKLPKGVLLYGTPGTGKTLLAKAVAGEAKVAFFSSSGSEFVEMFVGVGASRVRDLFEQAKKNAPSILFIDELDAVGRRRFAGIGGGHDEREQTLNQLLIELDGFESNEGIILIASTNRPDVLDPALMRPGRFDRHVNVPMPDVKGREAILKVHAKKVRIDKNVNLALIARQTPGFVGADLANVVNEAALLAARLNKATVQLEHFQEAIERVVAGPQRKSRVISDREKRIIAYHESGHTLIAKMISGADRVHKVSIISRGPALGYTLQLPEEDKYLTSRTDLIRRLCVLLGGRAAEQLVFNETTSGAADDISKVTMYAHRMVAEFGMSEAIGPIALHKEEGEVFLGRDLARQQQYSEDTARLIDRELKLVVDECYDRALKILSENRATLDALSKWLIEREVLEADEITAIIDNPAIVLPERASPSEQAAEPAEPQAEKDAACEEAAREAGENEAEDDAQDEDEAGELEDVPAEKTPAGIKSAQADDAVVKAAKKD